MKFNSALQNTILKAVAALANNGGMFKKRVKTPFNLKTALGFNLFTNAQKPILNYCPCPVSTTQRFPARNIFGAFVLVSMMAFSLTSCQKDAGITPGTTTSAPSPLASAASNAVPHTPLTPVSAVPVRASADTIPDNAMFKIQLGADSINTDETLIMFNRNSSVNFSNSNDARYFTGFGKVSLASVSADGVDMAIYNLPYTPGMPVNLDVKVKTDGTYFLKMSYEKNLPEGVQVLLKDAYLKDSIDVRKCNYIFNITKADTNSFGRNRFKLVIKHN